MRLRLFACLSLLALLACERDPARAPGASSPVSTPPAAAPSEEKLPPWPEGAFEGFSPAEIAHIQDLARPMDGPEDETNEYATSEAAASFGHTLFFDTRLSANGHIACASCHQPDHGFSMNAPLGMGHETTPRHPPALLNVAYQRWFDWDGKADSLWSQAARPLENPAEHRITRTAIARLILSEPDLRQAHDEAFPDAPLPTGLDPTTWPLEASPSPDVTEEQREAWARLQPGERELISAIFTRVLKALAAYQHRLVLLDAPFDQWVAQQLQRPQKDGEVMTQAQIRGLKHFLGKGRCITCHNGPLFSDMDFHNLGLGARPWLEGLPLDEGRTHGVAHLKKSELNALGPHSADREGARSQWTRFLVATPENRGQFKTPTLRNVALSPPYMHGGHLSTLEEVVRFYVLLEEKTETGHREDSLRPAPLSPTEQIELVAFLKALTGKPRKEKWFSPPTDSLEAAATPKQR